jgi:hypothetical protein
MYSGMDTFLVGQLGQGRRSSLKKPLPEQVQKLLPTQPQKLLAAPSPPNASSM